MKDRSFWQPQTIGMGAFFYFATAPIVNVTNYASYGRSAWDISLFFVVTLVAMALVHAALALFPQVYHRLASKVEPYTSVLATVCVLLAGLSALGDAGWPFFLACATLVGFTCASLVGIWSASPSLNGLRPSAFRVPPALLWAVAFYAVYRVLQYASDFVANGWQTAVPIVGVMALLIAYSPDHAAIDEDPTRKRAFYLLGVVAVVFAVAVGFLGYLSNYPGSRERSTFSPMVGAELLGVAAIMALCFVFRRLGERTALFSVGQKAAIVLSITVPLFLLGWLSGAVAVVDEPSEFLWEASIWILLLAAFMYGMRTSLYAVSGLAVGVMWEAWCAGQMLSRVALYETLPSPLFSVGLAATIVLLVSMFVQIAVRPSSLYDDEADQFERGTTAAGSEATDGALVAAGNRPSSRIDLVSNEPNAAHGAFDTLTSETSQAHSPLHTACDRISAAYGLSPRENEVLYRVCDGRSAKYISEELVISFNTARSHIRHIYEKLDIHSKQELISLIQSYEVGGD